MDKLVLCFFFHSVLEKILFEKRTAWVTEKSVYFLEVSS